MTAPYSNPDYQPPSPARMPKPRRRWPWVLGMVGALILGMIIGSAGKGNTPTTAAAVPSSTGPVASAKANVTQPATQAAGPKTEFGDGTFKVGEDITAGTYKSSGPRAGSVVPTCYWARMKDDSGSIDAIIANNSGNGPARITVKSGEYLQVTGCDFAKA